MKKKRMIGRKSQAAIFLIVAAVIILAGVLYFVYNKELISKETEPVQEQIVPIKKFIEGCMQEATKEAFTRISLSGGYIELHNQMENPRYSLQLGGGFKVPYWYHDGILDIPPETFIKGQVENFVQKETVSCLDNFKSFEGMYEVTPIENFKVNVEFNENDVSVDAKYPIEVVTDKGNFKALVGEFSYIHPIRFKKVYELSKLIMQRQYKDYFLESKTMDLISMDKNVPTTDIEATCKQKKWSLFEIKNKITKLLDANVKYIRVKGTDFAPGLYVPTPGSDDVFSKSYYQHHYIFQIDDKSDFRNFKVQFNYDDYPIEIYARPNENGVLKSNAQKGQSMLSFLCLQMWHFTYDISYPVVTSVIDKATDSSYEYRMNFAFKVDINHNQASRENKGTTPFDIVPDIDSDEFCNDAQNEITILTVDNLTGEDIKDVDLTFACGRNYCDLGKSGWISLGAASGITKKMPFCFNAVIRGKKEGYAEGYTFAQTDKDGDSYVLFLNPLKTMRNYKVVKHPISNPAIEQELSDGERATISIREINGTYESFGSFPLDTEFGLEFPVKDATFLVTIYIVNDETFIGGYSGEMKIGKDIQDANEIVFHAISKESKTEEEEFLFISSLAENSKKVQSPQIK